MEKTKCICLLPSHVNKSSLLKSKHEKLRLRNNKNILCMLYCTSFLCRHTFSGFAVACGHSCFFFQIRSSTLFHFNILSMMETNSLKSRYMHILQCVTYFKMTRSTRYLFRNEKKTHLNNQTSLTVIDDTCKDQRKKNVTHSPTC